MSDEKRVPIPMEKALSDVLEIEDEQTKLCRLVDLVKGYRSPYNNQTENKEGVGFDECKKGVRSQRGKIKRLIREHYA